MADQMDGEVRDLEHLNSEIKTGSDKMITICEDRVSGKKVYIRHHEALRDDDGVQYFNLICCFLESTDHVLLKRKNHVVRVALPGVKVLDPELSLGGIQVDWIIFMSVLLKCLTIQNMKKSITMVVKMMNRITMVVVVVTGQQQSALTGNFDTSDLHLDDGASSPEESISTAGLGTTENVHAEKTDTAIISFMTEQRDWAKKIYRLDEKKVTTTCDDHDSCKNGGSSSPGGRDIKRRKKHICPQKPEDDDCLSSDAASPLDMLYDSGDDELIAPFGGGSSQSGQQQQSAIPL
nr:hypothetical protein [Tanacetum cinerariifolium]